MSLHDDIQATAVAAADLAIAPLLEGHRAADRMRIAQVAVDAARTFLQKQCGARSPIQPAA